MLKPIRVFIVDDSAVARQINTKVVTEAHDNFTVVGSAPNGKIALEKLKLSRYKADVILMDIMMPEMDGIETISHILDRFPTPVIIVSSLSQEDVDIALSNKGMSAFESGAVEFVNKPNILDKRDFFRFRRVLKEKISALSQVNLQLAYTGFDFKSFLKDEEVEEVKIKYKVEKTQYRNLVIVIGASTGGPRAISLILSKLASRFPPIVIVQHMPKEMTDFWVKRLQSLYPHLRIKLSSHNEILKQNHVYIAPGGKHCAIRSGKTIRLYTGEPVNFVMPSIDVTFISAAKAYGNNVLAFILTGMGKDGLEGARMIKRAGGSVLAEHESTAVIYAMPRAIVEANLADDVVPLHDIPKFIRRQGWMSS
ncbi:MAG: chemotaxis-specific protein-glutamate methyltransferase CheB [Candidatus Hodarchaeales archaeon]|jgi:two-component system chemotaxis response regulator CheB